MGFEILASWRWPGRAFTVSLGAALLSGACGGARIDPKTARAHHAVDPLQAYAATLQLLRDERYQSAGEDPAQRTVVVHAHSDEDGPSGGSGIRLQVTFDGDVAVKPSGALPNKKARKEFAAEIARLQHDVAARLDALPTTAPPSAQPSAMTQGATSPQPVAIATVSPLPATPPLATPPLATPPLATPPQPVQDPSWFVGAPQVDAYAVVIGVEKYGAGIESIPGAALDAQRFAEMAKRTLGVPDNQVSIDIDEQATKGRIESRIAWAQNSVPAGGRIYFYFSGHGVPVPKLGADGKPVVGTDSRQVEVAYIVPSDANADYVRESGIPIPDIVAKLGRSKAKEVLAFIDACYSGAGIRDISKVTYGAATAQTAVFAAAGATETAGPIAAGRRGGLFTAAVLEGVGKGRADTDGDGRVSLQELGAWVPGQVQAENQNQRPQLISGPGISTDRFMVAWNLPHRRLGSP